MNKIVWESPQPSSGYYKEPKLEIRTGREHVIIFQLEQDNDILRTIGLHFLNVVHYRVTYLFALTSDLIKGFYDNVIEIYPSILIDKEVKISEHRTDPMKYKHFRICFDDGPCFDFICTSFKVTIE